MSDRFVITITNPEYMHEVIVWDRKDNMVRYSTQYIPGSARGQQRAIDRCQRWIDAVEAQLELDLGETQ